MTREQLTDCAAGLGSRDFLGFADKVSAIDPTLGTTVRLHAEASDGNSPDLPDWIDGTMDDDLALTLAGIDSPEGAESWWFAKYI